MSFLHGRLCVRVLCNGEFRAPFNVPVISLSFVIPAREYLVSWVFLALTKHLPYIPATRRLLIVP